MSKKNLSTGIERSRSIYTQQRAKTCQSKKKKSHYFTTGRFITEERIKAMEEEIGKPYQLPQLKSLNEAKKFWQNEKEKQKLENERPYSEHHNYKSRLKLAWKSERLFVPDDFTLPGSSMTDDIDPTFFTIVLGRPIKEKTNTKKYLRDIRNCFTTRLKTGFYLDEVLLTDERYLNEMNRLPEVRGNFLSVLKGFEEFLKEDHGLSSTLLEEAKEETTKSKNKLKMINALKEEIKKISTTVLVVEEQWRHLKMFQKFLFLISPSEWRKINDPNFAKQDERGKKSDQFLQDSDEENEDLDVRISKFKEDVRRGRPPVLYFENPQEVLHILSELEKNNMRALVYSKELDFPAEEMIAEVEKAKIRFKKDESALEKEVAYLRDLIEKEEKKAKSNEAKMKEIAYGIFRDLIANEDYLSVTSFVEDVYEDVVGPNDGDLDLIAMVKGIELEMENVLLDLDCLPSDVMVQCTRQFYREQKREMKEAIEAEKKVHQMEILLKRLSKALEPPKKFVPRRMVSRSLPPEELMFEFEPPKILSKKEKGQLFFFGEAPENVRLYKPLCL